MAYSLTSLTIFFPFLNDKGTVEKQIKDAYFYGKKITKKLQVIALHGGHSSDNTFSAILKMKRKYPSLVVINKEDNCEGYAVIKYAFHKVKNDWVFYTDGDAQYHVNDLIKLVKKQNQTNVDVVNGYKIRRHDSIIRILLGLIYQTITYYIFSLPIRDVHCDFRLIRKKVLDKVVLTQKGASVLPELIIELKNKKAKFAEVGVHHYDRVYGKSNFTILELIYQTTMGGVQLFLKKRP